MSGIKIYKGWGNPRKMAEVEAQIEIAKRFGSLGDPTPHGMTPGQIEQLHIKGERMLGGVYSPRNARSQLFAESLPPGRAPEFRTAQMAVTPGPGGYAGGNGSSLFTTMRPYQPEFESPDRQMFPIHRRIANTYWRLFNKMDPVIAAVIEMFSQLPWSDFQLAGEGVDGEVKEAFEYMVDQTRLRTILPQLVSEFLIIGEVIPHLFFDDTKGIWTYIALHNPDQINVVYSPFVKMDTVMEFVPDQKLRELVMSDHPMLARVRETMPPELVSHLRSGQNIPLSPVNATFIPRKLHPYDLRGTSVISRLWRTLMLEDAIWSATIQTARRAASPLKVAKLGDPQTSVIPPPSEERRVQQLLAQAEMDPQAWLIYNYQIGFDMVGAPERLMSINTHYELLERIKLVALGVSKSFVSGETSYSSAASGLTVFLQRLKAVRDYFVNEWLIPKYFLPVAVINEWIKPSKAQASGGRIRVKQSSKDNVDERRYIIPTIEWAKSLDPTVDKERIDAMQALEQGLGIKITDQRKYAAIGLDAEEEQKQLVEEQKFKRDLAGDDPQLQVLLGLAAPATGEGGEGGGNVLSPGIPPEAMGIPPEGMEGAPGSEPGGAGGAPPPGGGGVAATGAEGEEPKPADKPVHESQHWSKDTVAALTKLFGSFDPSAITDEDIEPWIYALKDPAVEKAIKSEDANELWMGIESWLIDENYPSAVISDLENTLTASGILKRSELFTPESIKEAAIQLGVNIEETEGEDLLLGPGTRSKDS